MLVLRSANTKGNRDIREIQVHPKLRQYLEEYNPNRRKEFLFPGRHGLLHIHKVSVRVGPDIQAAVVGSPAYFVNHPVPKTPQDLAGHRCINYRFVSDGGLYPWEFEEDGRSFQVRVDGPLVFNNGDLILAAALAGLGLGYLFEDKIADHVAEGRLIRVLA